MKSALALKASPRSAMCCGWLCSANGAMTPRAWSSWWPTTADETWGAVHYPLDAPGDGAWMGLSEITLHGDWVYVVERDNQIADNAATKKLYRVPRRR
jgi:hypothetical protein